MHLPLAVAVAVAVAASSSLVILAAVAFFMFRRWVIPRCCHCGPVADDEEWAPNTLKVADEPPPAAGLHKPAELIRKFTWDEVRKLTGEFTAAVIGHGGFSTVYLGGLPESTPAAFKVQHSSERLYRAFLQERDVLLRIKHPNIVRLLGYSDDCEEGVLVFEYVPNGTLHEVLHPNVGGPTPSVSLPWSRRMSILFKVATAVDYLHDGCDLQIVHGDLTASNVLLDGRLDPKLCDFGNARMGFSAAVKPAAAGRAVGSPGYADPHYLRTGIISKKSDVYSFGVLVLEMVTGIPAVGSGDERLLTVVMRERGWDRVETMVDPALGTKFDAGELATMCAIAGKCVGGRPALRPSMGEIVRTMREGVKLHN